MAQFEAKKAEEERLREEEAKKTGKPPAKVAAPAKKAPGKDDKPQLDIPKLAVPEVTPFESVMGNKYVRERQYTEIAQTILEPPKEEEEEAKGGEEPNGAASPTSQAQAPVA